MLFCSIQNFSSTVKLLQSNHFYLNLQVSIVQCSAPSFLKPEQIQEPPTSSPERDQNGREVVRLKDVVSEDMEKNLNH